MGTQILKDCTIWLNQFDLTADVNQMDRQAEVEEKPCTTFASGGDVERKGGLKDSRLQFMTFWDPALAEAVIDPLLGTGANVVCGTPNGVFGDVAYFARGLLPKGSKVFQVGEMAKLDSEIVTSASEGLIRGHLIAPKATRTTTANGSARLEGAVAATEKVYALAQVFSVAGTGSPTLALKIQSDDNAGFTTPTDRITFTNFTATGYQMSSLAGAITDTHWRAVWTITGTGPQFGFAVSLGIQ
jgi:hypothetical protein